MTKNLEKTKIFKKLSVTCSFYLKKYPQVCGMKKRIKRGLFYTNKNKKDSLDLNYFPSD